MRQRTIAGSEAVQRRDVSSVRAALTLCNVSNSANRPDMASADNCAKRFRAFIRQIFFGKECARMDTRARSFEGAGYRLKLSFVTGLDAIEGGQVFWVCSKHLRP